MEALVTGSIDMKGNSLNNVGDPVNPQDVATKDYVDRVGGSPFFKENGNYQAMHTINMNFRKLVNLQEPIEPYDAVTEDYVDYVKTISNKSLNNNIDKRPHIIAVHANYHGHLRKGEFKFAFGGNAIQPQPNSSSGVLIPHSGCIKN